MAGIKNKIKLGIIGMSDGNGHPYSWAAICNGYDKLEMQSCPFPVIPEYLSKETWPDAAISNAEVTHIWTQDLNISNHIAKASRIPNISATIEDMIPNVDAVLLARDDAENHLKMALPIIKSGLPIFIDKPLALSIAEANEMYAAQKYQSQIYSCSGLRFADELKLNETDLNQTGPIKFVEARTPKSWEKYAVHLLDPIVTFSPQRGKLLDVRSVKIGTTVRTEIKWENLTAFVNSYGQYASPLEFTWYGETGFVTKTFKDTFNAFKKSIQTFVHSVETKIEPIKRSDTLEIVEIIERGIHG